MNKEYISPEIQTVAFSLDSTILSVSETNPSIEDFYVTDGQW